MYIYAARLHAHPRDARQVRAPPPGKQSELTHFDKATNT